MIPKLQEASLLIPSASYVAVLRLDGGNHLHTQPHYMHEDGTELFYLTNDCWSDEIIGVQVFKERRKWSEKARDAYRIRSLDDNDRNYLLKRMQCT